MSFIPEESIAVLPFSAEPISDWKQDELDLLEYIDNLFDRPAVVISPDGTEHETDYSSYSKYLLAAGHDEFWGAAIDFVNNARKRRSHHADEALHMSATGEVSMPIPELWRDKSFGLMAKYAIGWEATLNVILSEGKFFSIEHILESSAELRCSTLLASNMYYKQALQVLRGFLEHHVVQLYFCDNEEAFEDWKNNEFRVPGFRGKSGMLNELVSKGMLSASLAAIASDLYGLLNGCIHSAEDRLIFQGIFEGGKSGGVMFKYPRFQQWCDLFARCADFGIRALKISVDQWETTAAEEIRCSVCHNKDEFDVTLDERLGHHPSISFTCRRCGNSHLFSLDALVNRGLITIEEIDDTQIRLCLEGVTPLTYQLERFEESL
jgi:hypothetical protein